MFKARIAAEKELVKAYEKTGLTEQQVREFIAKNPKYASPLHHSPHTVAGSAANLVYEVAPLIQQSTLERAKIRATKAATSTIGFISTLPQLATQAAKTAADPELHARLQQDWL